MAHPIPFREATRIIERPANMTVEECGSMEIFQDSVQMVSRWQFSDEEIAELKLNGGKVYMQVMGQMHPPIYVSPLRPFTEF